MRSAGLIVGVALEQRTAPGRAPDRGPLGPDRDPDQCGPGSGSAWGWVWPGTAGKGRGVEASGSGGRAPATAGIDTTRITSVIL